MVLMRGPCQPTKMTKKARGPRFERVWMRVAVFAAMVRV